MFNKHEVHTNVLESLGIECPVVSEIQLNRTEETYRGFIIVVAQSSENELWYSEIQPFDQTKTKEIPLWKQCGKPENIYSVDWSGGGDNTQKNCLLSARDYADQYFIDRL